MRSFKKIAAMIMAVAMLCSFTALAADVALIDVADTTSDNPSVTLGYNWDSTDALQTTMLVYKAETTTLEGADVIYINQFAQNADNVVLDLTAAEPGKYTVVAGGMDVAEAVTKEFNYTAVTYPVTVTFDEDEGLVTNNYTGTSLDAVNKGTEITFTFMAKKLGYIPEVTVNSETISISGNTLTISVDDAKTIDVEFVEAQADATEYQSFNGAEIHSFSGDSEAAEDADRWDSKLMFGKAIAPTNATVTEAGMYLEKWDGSAWKAYETETVKEIIGPYFKANSLTSDGKYGIRFIRFNRGTYQVKSYVKYDNDQYAYGTAVEFTVE